MGREGKVIIFAIFGTVLAVAALAVLLTKGSSGGGDSLVPNTQAQNILVSPGGVMNLGDVAYSGGVVTKSFDVKNVSENDITLKKITTSCMCTTAKFSVDGKDSKFYGMEMQGDLNPLIGYTLPAGKTGQVVFEFDPKAHGPAGIGSFQRTVTLFFDSGYLDLNFDGIVTDN